MSTAKIVIWGGGTLYLALTRSILTVMTEYSSSVQAGIQTSPGQHIKILLYQKSIIIWLHNCAIAL
jgi:hypothetical protein